MINKPLTTIQAEARAAFDTVFEPMDGGFLSGRRKQEIKAFLDTQLSLAHAAGKAEGREEAQKAIAGFIWEHRTADDGETVFAKFTKESLGKATRLPHTEGKN